MSELLEIVAEVFLDAAKMLPFLFFAYLLVEYLEHRSSRKFVDILSKSSRKGVLFGALLGGIPQCGFASAAANLYSGRMITVGTLIAVFVSTSDEAVPILLTYPDKLSVMVVIIVMKIALGIVAGMVADGFIFKRRRTGVMASEESPEQMCDSCGCRESHSSIWKPAVKHTLIVYMYILVITFGFECLLYLIGEEILGVLLLNGSFLQPFIAGLVGMIPNCASSVMLTELFVEGTVSIGSLLSGLSAGAGSGLIVLFKSNRNVAEKISIVLYMYCVGAVFGILIDVIFGIFA